MNRFETIIVALAAFGVAAAYAPAFGQKAEGQKGEGSVVFDGKDSGTGKQAAPDIRNGKQPRVVKKGHEAPPAPPKEPTFTATGGFESTKEKARESAIRAAVDKFTSTWPSKIRRSSECPATGDQLSWFAR